MMTEKYQKMLEAISDAAIEGMLSKEGEPNMVDIIAQSRGWLPLVLGEKMTVHYGGKEYEIKRNE